MGSCIVCGKRTENTLRFTLKERDKHLFPSMLYEKEDDWYKVFTCSICISTLHAHETLKELRVRLRLKKFANLAF